jgi:transposase
MRNVRLTEVEEITIVEMRKFHPKSRVRERAQMIELSNKGKSINEITNVVGKNRDTVSTWLSQYEKYGIAGLFDDERSGRNPKVKDSIKDRIIEIAESENTCSSEYITEIIEDEFRVKLHPNTIKYHLKKRKVCLQKNKKQPKGEKRWVKIR